MTSTSDFLDAILEAEGLDRSEADATTMSCLAAKLRVGVFFDGTYNDATNAAAGIADRLTGGTPMGSYDTSITHPAHLSTRYFGPNDDDELACGGPNEVFRSIYESGAGATAGADDNPNGGGSGLGGTGVERARLSAIRRLRAIVQQFSITTSPDEIIVDVFGFSRGAATARIFCNSLALGVIPNAKVRFLGLFDTVAALGNPSDQLREAGYNLNLAPHSAETVVQLTAHHEIRENFTLTSVLPGHGTEIALPGVHGTLGGSTPDWASTAEINYPLEFEMLAAQGVLPADLDVPEPRIYESEIGAERRNPGIDYFGARSGGTVHVPVRPGLRILSLEVMHGHAIKAGVPFHDLAPAMVLPELFAPLRDKALAGRQLDPADFRMARGYIHPSAFPFSRGLNSSSLVSNPENDYVREIIPNRPDRAAP